MWYYIKQAFLPFVYLIFLAVTALGILMIENLIWLKVILLTLNLGVYVFIVYVFAYKDGQEALKTRCANDLERKNIIMTGEGMPLKLKEEYKPWKGFLTGFITCVPLIVLMIIHVILVETLGDKFIGCGAVASFIYMAFFAFTRVGIVASSGTETVVVVNPYIHLWSLIAIPVIMLTIGIGYILGAKKIERQHDKIKEQQKSIYGDKI